MPQEKYCERERGEREGGREKGRARGREGGREREREGEREGGREGGREGERGRAYWMVSWVSKVRRPSSSSRTMQATLHMSQANDQDRPITTCTLKINFKIKSNKSQNEHHLHPQNESQNKSHSDKSQNKLPNMHFWCNLSFEGGQKRVFEQNIFLKTMQVTHALHVAGERPRQPHHHLQHHPQNIRTFLPLCGVQPFFEESTCPQSKTPSK